MCVSCFIVFVPFQCGVLGQVWYLIVSIPDLCLLTYFYEKDTGNSMPSMYSAMWKRVCGAWYNVPRTAIENLYKYVPRLIATVIEAKFDY